MKELKEVLKRLSGLCWLVFIIFLIMKLTGGIEWNWWWVTSPLWGQFPLGFIIGIIVAIINPKVLE